MKHLDEYRAGDAARELAALIRATVTRPWTLMEICGGQTHSIVRSGLDTLLPDLVTLVHGPGCPVCVTPVATLDRALRLAARPGITFTSFGDMLRVPGTRDDLLRVRAAGGDVRTVYSPLDAVALAERMPERHVVFFAVGFETTAPANAMAVRLAAQRGLTNFSLLAAHVRVPPAMRAILDDPDCRVQGFLAAGHVCTIVGTGEYEDLARTYRVPIVVTGFEPVDILQGILLAVRQLEDGRAEVENQYARAVRRDGNRAAQDAVREVFEPATRAWRGLGAIADSGLRIRDAYAQYDAERRFPDDTPDVPEPAVCQSGLVLQGRLAPTACPAFGDGCTPEHPLGAPMVSSEGACAAYYRYRRTACAAASRAEENAHA